ncbi:MAG: hypothetical protein HON43_00075 [Alphaproteobacteria bacterium]|jgi:autotransporter translocation and assembly factor TamB|nr:hypothetical protein [Alphaproteobacteria bacterium]MBT5390599.1 hypothetical protein [Alphaproteobacteria bacterium]
MKKYLIYFSLFIGALTALLISSVFAAILVLQFENFRTPLLSTLVSKINKESSITISIDKVEGFIPFQVNISSLSLSDEKGPWLVIKNLKWDWKASHLFMGRMQIRQLNAESIQVLHLPSQPDSKEKKPETQKSTYGLPLFVNLSSVRIAHLLLSHEVAGTEVSTNLSGHATISPFGQVSATVHISDLSMEKYLQNASLSLTARYNITTLATHIQLDGKGDLLKEVSDFVGDTFTLKGLVAYDASALKISDFSLKTPHGSAVLDGSANTNTHEIEGSLKIHYPSVALIGHAIGKKLSGSAALETIFSGTLKQPTVEGRIGLTNIEGDSFKFSQASIEFKVFSTTPLTAPDASLTVRGNGNLQSVENNHFPDVTLLWDFDIGFSEHWNKLSLNAIQLNLIDHSTQKHLATAASKGTFKLKERTIDGNLNASAENLAQLSPISGNVTLSGDIKGPLSDLSTHLTLKGKKLRDAHFSSDSLLVTLSLKGLPETPSGTLSAILEKNGLKVSADLSGHFSKEHILTLKEIRLKASNNTIDGTLSMSLKELAAEGRLIGDIQDLSVFSEILEHPIEGHAKIKASLENEDFKLSLNGQDLKGFGGEVASVSFSSGLTLPKEIFQDFSRFEERIDGKASLDLERITWKKLVIEKGFLSAKKENGTIAASLNINGDYINPFDIQSQGTFHRDPMAFSLSQLEGTYGTSSFALIKPLKAVKEKEVYKLLPMEIQLTSNRTAKANTGHIRGHGQFGTGEMSLQAHFSQFSLEFLHIVSPDFQFLGDLSGSLSIGGKLKALDIDASLQIKNLRNALVEKDVALKHAYDFEIDAHLQNKALSAHGSLRGRDNQTLEFETSLTLAPDDAFPIATNLPTKLQLKGDINLFSFITLVAPNGTTTKGLLTFDLNGSGTIKDPHLAGNLQLKKGFFENSESGVLFPKIELSIEGAGSKLVVHKVTLDDNEKGRGSIEGAINLSNLTPSFNIKAAFDKLRILNSDLVKGSISGNLHLTGNTKDLSIKGKLKASPVWITIPNKIPPSIATLKIEEINLPPSEKKKPKDKKTFLPISTNVTIDIPNEFFINGQGLQSEWKGSLAVSGLITKPSLQGALKIIRGSYTFLGRDLDLVEGKFVFTGGSKINPLISAKASIDAGNIVAFVQVDGSINKLNIALHSNPELPSGEILSHILFGKEPGSLTPAQSIELANAIQEFTSNDNTGFLDGIRNTLGLGSLSFDTTASGSGVLEMGRYIAKDLYLKIQQGLNPADSKAVLEMQVLPFMSVDTEAGPVEGAGAGVNLKWRY